MTAEPKCTCKAEPWQWHDEKCPRAALQRKRGEDFRSSNLRFTRDQLDRLGKFADTCENLRAALDLPMPAQFHCGALKQSLPSLGDEIKALYVEVSGENPWE